MRFGPRNRARIRTIKAGAIHLKIYTGTLKKRPIYTAHPLYSYRARPAFPQIGH